MRNLLRVTFPCMFSNDIVWTLFKLLNHSLTFVNRPITASAAIVAIFVCGYRGVYSVDGLIADG